MGSRLGVPDARPGGKRPSDHFSANAPAPAGPDFRRIAPPGDPFLADPDSAAEAGAVSDSGGNRPSGRKPGHDRETEQRRQQQDGPVRRRILHHQA